MWGFKTQLDTDKKCFFGYDGINLILARKGIVHSLDVDEPIYIGTFGPLLKDGVDDV